MQDNPDQGEKNDETPDAEASVRDESVIIQERSRIETSGRNEIRQRPEVKRELEPLSRPEDHEAEEEPEGEAGSTSGSEEELGEAPTLDDAGIAVGDKVSEADEEAALPEDEEVKGAQDSNESDAEKVPVEAAVPVAAASPKASVAEDMSTLTSSADEQTQHKKLSSLPFPWFRTVLVGLLIPIFTVLLTAVGFALTGQPVTFGAITTVMGWLIAVPVVAALLVVLIAAWVLKRMDVGRAFFLAAGTLVCSAGIIVLAVNEFYPTLAEFGWQAWSVADQDLWVLVSLAFIGAAVILVLIFLVHTLGRYLPKLVTVLFFLVVVAAPWLVHFYGDDLGLISQKSDIITASADAA